jgi:hypothetical protein
VIRVRNGQRRTLAAREVGLTTVPVFVLPSSAADASEETIERIVHQIVTNDQKQDLTDAQRGSIWKWRTHTYHPFATCRGRLTANVANGDWMGC